MSELTAREVLVKGRTRLSEGHLAKHVMADGRGGFCAFGALFGGSGVFAVLADDDPILRAGYALHDALGAPRREGGGTGREVVEFNNADATTKDDVLALFDKAIAATPLESEEAAT